MTVPNADGIVSGRKQIITSVLINPAWADHFDNISIPDDMAFTIKAAPANAGQIYVARSKAEALSIETSWPLIPNEPISYRVKNASSLWLSGRSPGGHGALTPRQHH